MFARSPVSVELADPGSPEARRLLVAHERDMAARYSGGSWEGTGGHKDLFWIARDERGRAMACLALRVLRPDRVEVKHLYVAPEARRSGLASALMDVFEAEAARRRASVVLETGSRQPEAIALYLKRGYRERGCYEGADICGGGAMYFERPISGPPRPASRRAGGLYIRLVPDAVRTPDELLQSLPDFPFEPFFRELDGLRLAHIDEGQGEPVVFLHGEPTWSFLWRKVIPPVRDAGYRCIALDLPGFGRSDKPVELGWYSYDRHFEAVAELFERLELERATVVVHDWGGPIGLRMAVEHPGRVARMVVLDTGLFTGHQKMTDAWQAFRDFVERTEDLPVGFLVRGACRRDPGELVIAAYDAPFPNVASKAGARAFPLMLPTTPDAPGAAAGQRVLEALRADQRPKLFLWADSDPVIPLETGRRFAAALGAELDHVIADASHFLQEDAGPEIGARIAGWLAS